MAISNQYTTKIEIKIGDKSNLKTLFHEDWRYFTVPSKTRKDWRHDEGEGTYAFNLSNDLLECYKNNGEIYNILESIKNECILSTMTISANKGTEDTDDNSLLKFNHYRCNISLLLLRKLKLLFI
ncbi:MAG: hypothetical protein RSG75_05275, partial [Cellulosilyticaceae bacterium]